MSQTSLTTAIKAGNLTDHRYHERIKRISDRLTKAIYGDQTESIFKGLLSEIAPQPLFHTSARDGLWDYYLSLHPAGPARNYVDCSTCQAFFEDFGGLVVINPDGTLTSALWHADDGDEEYEEIHRALRYRVERSKVTGFFVPYLRQLGVPVTGVWRHYAVDLPTQFPLMDFTQATSLRLHVWSEQNTLVRSLQEFSLDLVLQAVSLLESGTFRGSERHVDMARWFLSVKEAYEKADNVRNAEHITWLAAADAPRSWCHIRNTCVGSMLKALGAGRPLAAVKCGYESNVAGENFQRPKAPPTTGNIKVAQQLIEELGLESSLRRRFARFEDLRPFWIPVCRPKVESPPKLFDNLITKGANTTKLQPPDIDYGEISYAVFQRNVLPKALEIEVMLSDRFGAIEALTAFLTAADPASPPILKWDTPDDRNPVSWHFHAKGSTPAMFNLPGQTYIKVIGITQLPPMWTHPQQFPAFQNTVCFLLKDAKDTVSEIGLSLFPETLRSDLFQIRSVLEAHSNKTPLESIDDPVAGVVYNYDLSRSGYALSLRVTTTNGRITYLLDRWE